MCKNKNFGCEETVICFRRARVLSLLTQVIVSSILWQNSINNAHSTNLRSVPVISIFTAMLLCWSIFHRDQEILLTLYDTVRASGEICQLTSKSGPLSADDYQTRVQFHKIHSSIELQKNVSDCTHYAYLKFESTCFKCFYPCSGREFPSRVN